MNLAELTELVVYVWFAVAASWAAGYAIAEDSWWADTRADLEDRVYWDGQQVRDEHPDANEFWARVRPVGGGNVLTPAELAETRNVAVAQLSRRDLRDHVRPTGPARLATVVRGKVVDMLGCPICSGWWGGLAAMVVLVAVAGPLHFHWWLPAAQFLGWGFAHRVGWD